MKTIRRIEELRRQEHGALVEMIVTLCECVRREEFLAAGHPSLWGLLVERLKSSPAAASRRNAAVKIALRHPQVIAMLREHRTSLTCLAKVAHLLRAEDFPSVLRAIDGASSDEVERILAARRPVAKPRERVRRTVVRISEGGRPTLVSLKPDLPLEISSAAEVKTGLDSGAAATRAAEPARTTAAPMSTPETEDRVTLTFSVTAEDYAAFERARAKASRKHGPGVTIEQTFHEMVRHYLDRAPSKPRETKPPTKRTRHIPAATRREVTARDGHRCTYVAADGVRCSATHDLQVDHIDTFAGGGSHRASNLRLLCGKHNRLRARTGDHADRPEHPRSAAP